MKNKFENIKAIFFDTSDTLYKSAELEAAYPKKLVELIAETRNLSIDDAASQLKETVERLKTTEKHVTKVRTAAEFGLSREQVHQQAFCKVMPIEYLSKDEALDNVMSLLAKHYKLGIISNLKKSHMLEIFSALGLSPDWFPLFVTEDIVKEIKPHHEPFLKAVELSGYGADKCLYVGDSPTKDMRPAHEVGMRTILVSQDAIDNEHPQYVDETIADVKKIIDLLELT
jgi:HAD superfamily hydrolase (TIGR01549 family)